MDDLGNNKKESVKLGVELKLSFSEKDEVERIKYTLNKLDWFREQKYKVNLPMDC